MQTSKTRSILKRYFPFVMVGVSGLGLVAWYWAYYLPSSQAPIKYQIFVGHEQSLKWKLVFEFVRTDQNKNTIWPFTFLLSTRPGQVKEFKVKRILNQSQTGLWVNKVGQVSEKIYVEFSEVPLDFVCTWNGIKIKRFTALKEVNLNAGFNEMTCIDPLEITERTKLHLSAKTIILLH